MAIAGKFDQWDATLTFPSTDVTTGVLDIKIQAASVNTGSGMKNGKLKGKDSSGAMTRWYSMYRSECLRIPLLVMRRQIRKMGPSLGTGLIGALVLLATDTPVLAQSVQFLPEIDTRLKLSSFMRVYVEAKDDRDAGVPSQFTIGPSLQCYFKPVLRLKNITTFDLDDAKPRALVLETGYRYITTPNEPPTNRMQPALTIHVPLKAGFLISDRNRADLDWKNGEFTWRYRNKLTIERTVAIYSFHFIPYIAAEPYYVDKYQKWSTTSLFVGGLFPVGKHVQFNAYYEHENNTGKKPNQQTNSIGLALSLYFSLQKG